jgi:outer membrane protein OmpA-like peptidoglycan-associated protein
VGGQRMGTQSPTHVARGEIDGAITTVLQKIRSDPRITGKIAVGLDSSTESISLRGKVASDEQRTIALNDANEVTDLGVGGMIGAPPPGASITALHTPPAAWSDSGAADGPSVPLCPGLTIVTAIASQGDYESIKTIESANSKEVRVKYTSEVGPAWWTNPSPQARHLMTTHRTVLTNDLESAHSYDQIFVGTANSSETAPGTTAIGTSAAVLRELKTKGEAELKICSAAEDVQVMDASAHQLQPAPPGGCYSISSPITLKRVGNEPTHVRVLVNGTLVDLPAVQALGDTGKEEFFFLDDERNPLALQFRLGIWEMSSLSPRTRKACEDAKMKPGLRLTGPISCDLPHGGDQDTLRVVKITTDCMQPGVESGSSGSGPGPAAGGAASSGAMAMEKSLAETGKVDVYSIYFAFNSDVLREESEPTLKEIAEVLRRHRDWKLRVAGHTDGVGGDEQNLDLSKRRAAAVKDALVKRYGLAAGRLSTTGFGKSQPKDTNDTLEGRGHNRRVELMKIS